MDGLTLIVGYGKSVFTDNMETNGASMASKKNTTKDTLIHLPFVAHNFSFFDRILASQVFFFYFSDAVGALNVHAVAAFYRNWK